MLRSGVRERPTCGSDWWSRQCIPELHLQGSCATFLLLVERTRTAPSALCASGGTLSVAQRDSAVSGYNPCAAEPPGHSAALGKHK
ncbi:EH domain-binding protein 1-like protein 1 [Dissostichus eleginoides]|uniref:EH domain-binding protein 1-like protein 1 n=1 Tax=Dissostichus eleginoides TaxID=100907 RepID=A0AAD9EX61_DISEL|nr:EH domain-binding protein 1-like protein 1 [Dissostichus eleginoides]